MIRLKTTFISTMVSLTLCTATALHAQERMREGTWENTVTSSGHTATRSHCFKQTDAAMSNGSAAMVRAETERALSKNGACKLKDFKLDDSALVLTMICGTGTVLQETKFHGGDSFETTMTATDGGVTRVSQIKGRRTGVCKAGDQ